jgi:membrane associated rhomboid family serine protease
VLPLRDNVPTRSFPVVTVALIATNFIVWFWQLGALDERTYEYAYYPCSVQGPCAGPAAGRLPWYEGTLSSMFMHGSWAHILGNMLFLWIFGNNIEDALGKLRFLVFYLLAGAAATFTQTIVTLHWGGTTEASIPNVGASGAIAGVLGAYLVLIRGGSVLTLVGFFLVPIPAIVFLGFWFLFQLWQGGAEITHPGTGGGVAFAAHVGGFVFGMLTAHLFANRRPLAASW